MRHFRSWTVFVCTQLLGCAYAGVPPAVAPTHSLTTSQAATVPAVAAADAAPQSPLTPLVDALLKGLDNERTDVRRSVAQAKANPAVEEEASASFSLILASWGLIALIALRRTFG